MKKGFYSCISITVSEWQTWQLFRELRTSANRWVEIQIDEQGNISDDRAIIELFNRGPDLTPDFEQDILIVVAKVFDDQMQERLTHDTNDIYYCGIDLVDSVFAVTERNTKLLEVRGINLQKPLFEQQWLKFRSNDDISRSLKNGNYFDIIEQNEDNTKSVGIGDPVKDQVANALGFRFYPDISDNNWTPSALTELFSFQRKLPISGGDDPTPTHTDLDYCIDLGLLARRRLDKKLTKSFLEYGGYINYKTVDDLVAFVLDTNVEAIFDKIQEDEPLDFIVRPEAHLLFLKWKEKFFENSKIEWEGLRSDVKRLIEGDKNVISQQALFLLTCYGGPAALSNLPKDFKKEVGLETSPPFSEIIDPVTPFQLTWGQVFIEKNQDLLGKITIYFAYAVLLLQVVLILFF
ncbi:hypothetical protein OAJ77_00850 [Rhodospirillales bacterium]|nr:hypothetical protein [Rhodospirillales bacterium]